MGRGRWAMEGVGHERGWGMDGSMVGDLGRGHGCGLGSGGS